jgi:hypothetical protein
MDMLVDGDLHVGLLFNFNVDVAAGGWKRVLRRG